MSRRNRLFIQGLPQLIQLKGHNHESIFYDSQDYSKFLFFLNKGIEHYTINLHTYSLTPGEILLLITPDNKDSTGRLIQYIGRTYVAYFNKKYHRSGSLWNGRYNSCLIEPSAYLLLVQKYIFSVQHDSPPEKKQTTFTHLESSHLKINQQQNNEILHIDSTSLIQLTPHDEYLKLGETDTQRSLAFQQFMRVPLSHAVLSKIQSCLAQNCLLGTQGYCKALEKQIHRYLRPRQSGRPRKVFHSQVADWVWLENQAAQLLQRHAYQEIRVPLLERWEHEFAQQPVGLQQAQEGNVLFDRQALLRGEGTSGCLRAIAQHQHLQLTSKLWYQGPMFRSSYLKSDHIEQYHQLGIEAFGYQGVDIELEHLMIQYDFFQSLQLRPFVELKMNTLGSQNEFMQFRLALRHYFHPFSVIFSETWLTWINQAPEKLLCCEEGILPSLRESAPKLNDFLSTTSIARFQKLTQSLSKLGIPYTIDPRLFPANDYCHTLFEWHTDKLTENTLLCRGGRYDDNASQLLGKPIYACGFAFMLEPLMNLLQLTHAHLLKQKLIDIVVIPKDSNANTSALLVGKRIRERFPQLSISNDCSHMKVPQQLKNADRLGARFVLLINHTCDQNIEVIDRETDSNQKANFYQAIGLISRSLN